MNVDGWDDTLGPPEPAAPGLDPTSPAQGPGRDLVVGGERFRVRLRPRRGHGSYEYDYDWLSGPDPGYGFGASGPSVLSDGQHRERIRDFLAEIDPGTGYLRES